MVMAVGLSSRGVIVIVVVSSRAIAHGDVPSHSVPFENVSICCFDFLWKSSCTTGNMSFFWLAALAIKMSVIASTFMSCPQKITLHGIKAIYDIKHQF